MHNCHLLRIQIEPLEYILLPLFLLFFNSSPSNELSSYILVHVIIEVLDSFAGCRQKSIILHFYFSSNFTSLMNLFDLAF